MTHRFLAIFAAPALALLPVHAAQAQDFANVAEDDLSELVRFALPSVFAQVQTMCVNELERSSYIYANSARLTERFQTASQGSVTRASQVLLALGGEQDPAMRQLISRMPPEVLGPFMSEMIAGKLAQDLKPEACEPINRTMELLDPLPTDNFADLVAYLTIYMADEEKRRQVAASDG